MEQLTVKQPKILVTGATGTTGRAVVDELLAKRVPVRAVVHAEDARSAALERKGAETVVADMFDPDQLFAAMRSLLSSLLRSLHDPKRHGFRSGGTRGEAGSSKQL